MSKAQKLRNQRAKNNLPIHRDFMAVNETGSIDDYYANFLSAEEVELAVAQYNENYDSVVREFKDKTKLHKADYPFLITAILLQCVRQYVLTPFSERVSADESEKNMTEKYGKNGKMTGRYYYASEDAILRQKSVPFDVVAGSKKFNLGGIGKGLSGNSHRFRTLGHDPILGYVFGTANIMTNTMTMYNAASYHIRYVPNATGISAPNVYANANTRKIFSAVWQRLCSDSGPFLLVASIVKEYLHLKSDISTNGLPIPFLSSISPDLSRTLAEHGLDAIRIAETGKQAAMAALINAIISILHGLFCAKKGEMKRNLYTVRTRKILLYSNLIASTSNVIYSAISNDWKKFDIGGLCNTLWRLYSDPKFFDKIKYEFINNELSSHYQKLYDSYSFYYT